MDLRQVVAQRGLALPRQRGGERPGADEGIAVAVAADPVAHAEEGRDLEARQGLLDLAVELGNLRQEGGAVVAERVLDLVVDGELGLAQHPRLPELGDAGADQRLVACRARARQLGRARRQQLGDRPLGVEDALPLHLGRVGGEHRRDPGVLERPGDASTPMPRRASRSNAPCERAALQVPLALVHRAAAQVVPVLGDVGEVREVAEGADHAHRAVARKAGEQPVEGAAGGGVALQPVGDRELADPLDQVERLLAFLLADHVAEDPPEQADVVDQRLVLGRGRVGGGASFRGHWRA